ncbi:MAG: DUF4142 domain-containing protein [Caulobacterales bacterium]|nr:DUF4142 domain-containing protein [Caulobacterales bacterium]
MRPIFTLGVAALCLAATSAAAQPKPPREFLKDALQGDNSEMRLGDLAAQRAASPAVRDFGRTLHDDHARAREEALRVAQRVGVPDTQAMAPEARQEARRLDRLRGRAFDREFIRYMIHDHRKDIADFRKASRRGGPVGDLASRTLPDLQRHLQMAQQLDRG